MRVATCLKLIVLGLLLIALGVALRVGVGLWRYHTSPEQLHALLYEQLTGALAELPEPDNLTPERTI